MTEYIQIGYNEHGDPIFRRRGPADDKLDEMTTAFDAHIQSAPDFQTYAYDHCTDCNRSKPIAARKPDGSCICEDCARKAATGRTKLLKPSPLALAKFKAATANTPSQLDRIETMLKRLLDKHG